MTTPRTSPPPVGAPVRRRADPADPAGPSGRGAGAVDLGVRSVRIGPVALPVAPRSVLVVVLLLALAVVVAVCSVLFGEIQMGFPRLVATLSGEGSAFEDYLVMDSRLPRVVNALLIGLALGMSGSIFQTISRNPLGSPDVIGFETGASTGGLVALLVLGSGFAGASVGAVIGGLATAVVVYALALRNGLDGLRLVLIGVGLGALLLSVNSMLIVQADVYDAQEAGGWLVGNLAGASWDGVGWLVVTVSVLCLAAVGLSRPLMIAELADDSAAGLGQRTDRLRMVAIAVGVLLSSIAVAAAGPIVFVALSAPQIARRLTGASGPNLVTSGLTGAVVLVLADHAARELFQPRQVPVGVVTGLIGGAFLAWLLTREWRKGHA
ncbi:iron chelate uptake ABC transporter family permease subunit [Nocardioides carbamazepini]|uniref:FecCD family ABC transporter permease n=1 Tax=Nocardioides carbamazepini TaxID=2854259 RepID=UPI002149F2E2|nr:iron chelate uptake ABC transporter family permease subunit [Nocardioides carbamazepini]MCR1781242.1 iron chelate uptake ABC transporter family permease subunit [Nocardioides carbamazepini]